MQAAIGTVAVPPGVEGVDVAVTQAVAPLRKTWPVRGLGALSEFADQPPLIAISGTILFVGLVRRKRAMAETGGRMMAAHLVATAIKSSIKARIIRTRPHLVAEGQDYQMHAGEADTHPLNSFPSGHTAGAVAVARAVVRGHPDRRAASYALAGGAALVQIPRCAHYPSDVAAGAAIGVIAELLVYGAEHLVTAVLSRGDR